MRPTDDNFVQGQNSVRERHTELGRHRLADVMLGTAYADILDPLMLSSVQLRTSPDGLFGSNRPTLEALIAAIPSRRVEMQLRSFASSTRRSSARVTTSTRSRHCRSWCPTATSS
jgi:hypothetical protein